MSPMTTTQLTQWIYQNYTTEQIADLAERLVKEGPVKKRLLEKQSGVAYGQYATAAGTCPVCGKRL